MLKPPEHDMEAFRRITRKNMPSHATSANGKKYSKCMQVLDQVRMSLFPKPVGDHRDLKLRQSHPVTIQKGKAVQHPISHWVDLRNIF
jgi:hypothetical protein